MANYQYPYQPQINQMANQFNQFQQIQQMFPQPQGSVYSINSPIDIGNVPIGSTGLSVALCLNESLMYIKSFQNGSPVIMTYRILPHNSDSKQSSQNIDKTTANSFTDEQTEKLKQIDSLTERVTKLEGAIGHTGGKFDDLL